MIKFKIRTIVQDRNNKFAETYKPILTNDEHKFRTKLCHKISNFYMFPKLHKLKEINKFLEIKRTEYIQI